MSITRILALCIFIALVGYMKRSFRNCLLIEGDTTMKNLRGLLTCLGLLGLMACALTPATAAQSFFGYTGLIRTPTTDALSQGQYSLGVYSLNMDAGPDATVYAGTVGLAEGFEVGYARLKADRTDGKDYFNAKYRFNPATIKDITVAAGVIDIANESDSTPYLVVSKSISTLEEPAFGEIDALRVNVGIGGGAMDGLFAGVSAVLGQRLTLMGEYDTNDVNFGARFAINDQFRLHGAVMSGSDVGLGLSWNKLY